MESQLKIVEMLIQEGESYTFSNFCLPRTSSQGVYGGSDAPEWSAFKIRAKNIVTQLLSENAPAVSLVNNAFLIRTNGNGSDSFDKVKSNYLKALNLLYDTLKNDIFGELKEQKSRSNSAAISNKVFIVHGHDQALKTDVERFLHELGLVPVVLHREADAGATIIEKFEKHSDVGYAFILLTPDEIAYTVDQVAKNESERNIEYRARANVIFEFGYFVGKLGRKKVCCLHKGDVTVPSDLNGLVYKKIDNSIDSQAYSIIKELKVAGYKINI